MGVSHCPVTYPPVLNGVTGLGGSGREHLQLSAVHCEVETVGNQAPSWITTILACHLILGYRSILVNVLQCIYSKV